MDEKIRVETKLGAHYRATKFVDSDAIILLHGRVEVFKMGGWEDAGVERGWGLALPMDTIERVHLKLGKDMK